MSPKCEEFFPRFLKNRSLRDNGRVFSLSLFFTKWTEAMTIKPLYQFVEYNTDGKVKIRNPVQALKYINHGARLYDHYSVGDCFEWVFDKDAVAPLFDLWCKRELE